LAGIQTESFALVVNVLST